MKEKPCSVFRKKKDFLYLDYWMCNYSFTGSGECVGNNCIPTIFTDRNNTNMATVRNAEMGIEDVNYTLHFYRCDYIVYC